MNSPVTVGPILSPVRISDLGEPTTVAVGVPVTSTILIIPPWECEIVTAPEVDTSAEALETFAALNAVT